MDQLSVVVPVYNEEQGILKFYKELISVLQSMPILYEVLFINDGSEDHTEAQIKSICLKDSSCFYFSFSRNFGKEAAMYAGLKQATGNLVVILDADLQHPVNMLPLMYNAIINEGYDCAAGLRVDRTGEGKVRNVFSHLFYRIINSLSDVKMKDGAGDFRMMTRSMVDSILSMEESNRYMKGIFSFVGFETKWIEFHNVHRAAGKSKWHFRQLISYALEGILSFSTTLITLTCILGCLFVFLSVLLLIGFLWWHQITSLSLLWISLFLLSGIQIICIALVGAYCAKEYMETKRRPIFIIKSTNRKEIV